MKRSRFSITLKNGFSERRMLNYGNGWTDAGEIVTISDVLGSDRDGWESRDGNRRGELLTTIVTGHGILGSTLPRAVLWRRYLQAMTNRQEATGS